MARLSARFGVGDPAGLRSSEWLVWWSSSASNVYAAVRTLGGVLKVSLHESGQCHVRAPGPSTWASEGNPPKFLDKWTINPASEMEFPFGIIVPHSELRAGPWGKHKAKGTQWVQAKPGAAIEIAFFLTRVDAGRIANPRSAAWHTALVEAALPDGRTLWVMAGDATLPDVKREELGVAKKRAMALLRGEAKQRDKSNFRMLLVSCNEQGTRRFVEVACLP